MGSRHSLGSILALAADELFDAAVSFVVGHLDGRVLGEKGGGRMQDAADAAIERELAATYRVDGDAGRIWRIFDGKFNINRHRHMPEDAAFDADEGDLVIELPRNVIARANVDVFVGETLAHD